MYNETPTPGHSSVFHLEEQHSSQPKGLFLPILHTETPLRIDLFLVKKKTNLMNADVHGHDIVCLIDNAKGNVKQQQMIILYFRTISYNIFSQRKIVGKLLQRLIKFNRSVGSPNLKVAIHGSTLWHETGNMLDKS